MSEALCRQLRLFIQRMRTYRRSVTRRLAPSCTRKFRRLNLRGPSNSPRWRCKATKSRSMHQLVPACSNHKASQSNTCPAPQRQPELRLGMSPNNNPHRSRKFLASRCKCHPPCLLGWALKLPPLLPARAPSDWSLSSRVMARWSLYRIQKRLMQPTDLANLGFPILKIRLLLL